jgi:hypothetical protein
MWKWEWMWGTRTRANTHPDGTEAKILRGEVGRCAKAQHAAMLLHRLIRKFRPFCFVPFWK